MGKINRFKEHKINESNEISVIDYLKTLNIEVSDEITDEQIEDILIDVSDIDDDKYHWVESELKKLKQ